MPDLIPDNESIAMPPRVQGPPDEIRGRLATDCVPAHAGEHGMRRQSATTAINIALCATGLVISSGCGGSPTTPAPVAKTESFTGTLQPQGSDFKTFSISTA